MDPIETKIVCGVKMRKDPAREPCFKVADTDAEMISWPEWTDESKRERIHRHMNNEMTTTEVAAQCLADFPDTPWELRMELARQVWDESRHCMGLYRRLKELGGRKGEFPIANFEWAVSSYLDSVVGRITVMNRTFEAGTMDLMAYIPDGWRKEGNDPQTAELLDAIAADEIQHVRFANQWVHKLCAGDRKNLFKVAQAVSYMDTAQKALSPPAGSTNLVGVSVEGFSQTAPVNIEDRRLAEFSEDEITALLKQHDLESLLEQQGA
jgi:uncharacterized ferritin-like protein (DUF455 family)